MKINSLYLVKEVDDLKEVENIDISEKITEVAKQITRASITRFGHVYHINIALNVKSITSAAHVLVANTDLRPIDSTELVCLYDGGGNDYRAIRTVISPTGEISILVNAGVSIPEGTFLTIFGTVII